MFALRLWWLLGQRLQLLAWPFDAGNLHSKLNSVSASPTNESCSRFPLYLLSDRLALWNPFDLPLSGPDIAKSIASFCSLFPHDWLGPSSSHSLQFLPKPSAPFCLLWVQPSADFSAFPAPVPEPMPSKPFHFLVPLFMLLIPRGMPPFSSSVCRLKSRAQLSYPFISETFRSSSGHAPSFLCVSKHGPLDVQASSSSAWELVRNAKLQVNGVGDFAGEGGRAAITV